MICYNETTCTIFIRFSEFSYNKHMINLFEWIRIIFIWIIENVNYTGIFNLTWQNMHVFNIQVNAHVTQKNEEKSYITLLAILNCIDKCLIYFWILCCSNYHQCSKVSFIVVTVSEPKTKYTKCRNFPKIFELASFLDVSDNFRNLCFAKKWDTTL